MTINSMDLTLLVLLNNLTRKTSTLASLEDILNPLILV
jgi:hypothetical protein